MLITHVEKILVVYVYFVGLILIVLSGRRHHVCSLSTDADVAGIGMPGRAGDCRVGTEAREAGKVPVPAEPSEMC